MLTQGWQLGFLRLLDSCGHHQPIDIGVVDICPLGLLLRCNSRLMCRLHKHYYHACEKGSAADVAVGRPVNVLPRPERCEKVDANGRSPGFPRS